MDEPANTYYPVRKHLPHNPPVSVSQYTAGALYFITICADRRHYGIIDGGVGAIRPTMVGRVVLNAPPSTPVGRVALNAPQSTPVGRVVPNAPHGGVWICRPTIAPLIATNNAIRLLFALDFYRTKGVLFPRLALVMPDHLHLIASLSETADMAKTIRNWKRWTAKATGIAWQDGFFDHRLRNEAEVAEKMDYVAMNPVRRGLCESAEDWPFRMTWQ